MSAKGKPGSELLRLSISKHALVPLDYVSRLRPVNLAVAFASQAKSKVVSATRPVDDPPARVELAELRRPKGGRGPLPLRTANARHHVRLSHEGAVHRQVASVQFEGGLLDLDIHREAGRREEAVLRPLTAAKVGSPAVWKV